MDLNSALMPLGILAFIFVLFVNTGWLGMNVLGILFDTSRETRVESVYGTYIKIGLSAVAEVILVTMGFLIFNHYWSLLFV